MGNVKIPYYVVPKGRNNGYWRPNAKMRQLGFQNICCGNDGPSAWEIAESWNAKWQAVRQGKNVVPAADANLTPGEVEERTFYPVGSVGAAFRRYRRSKAWTQDKKSRTHEDWWRAWRFIKPIFGDVDPDTIEPEHIEDWRQEVLNEYGLDAAHRATKIWRALWKVMATYKMCQRDMDPSANIRNIAPKGRTVVFSEGEVVRRVKQAIRMGFPGLACIMALAWDTQFSPVDCRTLTTDQSREDDEGLYFVKYREKTKDTDEDATEVVGTLTRRTQRLIKEYLAWQGTVLLPDAPMFRNRSGNPYTKDTLGRDFRRVRNVEVPGCRKQLRDFRRSGAVEATAGNVESLVLSQKMGNSIDSSKRLQDTYIPKRKATVQLADEARRRGRQKLRENKGG